MPKIRSEMWAIRSIVSFNEINILQIDSTKSETRKKGEIRVAEFSAFSDTNTTIDIIGLGHDAGGLVLKFAHKLPKKT